jgi:transposase
MMGQQTVDQSQLFYLFNLEKRIPERHLLRRINPIVGRILAEFREKLRPFYSEIGRPSIDPEMMIRMLIIGYCYSIRFERRLCEEVALHLAYRWFCRLDFDDKVPDHSTFSVNRHGRFRGQRPVPPNIRGGGAGLHGRRSGQGRRLYSRCECHGSRRQPLSWQGS